MVLRLLLGTLLYIYRSVSDDEFLPRNYALNIIDFLFYFIDLINIRYYNETQ